MENTKTQNEQQKTSSMTDSKNSPNEQNTDSEKSPIKTIAGDALNQLKDRTNVALSEQKTNLTSGIKDVAGSIRQLAEKLDDSEQQSNVGKMTARYGTNFAQGLDKVSRYLENADFKQLAGDLELYARRQPALFVAGAFALGLVAARFMKTARPLENFNISLTENNSENKMDQGNKVNLQASSQPV